MNWWEHPAEIANALTLIPDCVIGLHARVTTREGQFIDYLYSGFVIAWKTRIFWFSTGHSVQRVRDAFEDPANDKVALALIDNINIAGAQSIPISPPIEHLLNFESVGFDLGFIPLNTLDVLALGANSEFRPFVLDNWVSPVLRRYSGLYVSGFVRELNQSTPVARKGKRIADGWEYVTETRTLRPGVSCLPLSRPVSPRRLAPTRLKQIDGSEVCWLLADESVIVDAEGLSGGPVWIADRSRGYRNLSLWGLQTSWCERSRAVRVLRIDHAYLQLSQIIGQNGV